MTITSYPFDNQDTTEAQFSELMREMADSGVADSSDGIGLKVTANGTGMSATVQPGFAVVRGFGFKSTAVEPITFTASAPTTVRWDLVVLRLDPNTNSTVLTVLPGTPAATQAAAVPATPNRTTSGIYELALAQVLIRAGAPTVLATDVVDKRDLQGGSVGSWATVQRPTSPRKRKFGYNETTGVWENWDGAAWVPVIQPLTSPAQWSWGGATGYGPWRIPNGGWNRAPGATGYCTVQAGHLYQATSQYSLLMDQSTATAGGQVRASIQVVADAASSPSAAMGEVLFESWSVTTTINASGVFVKPVGSETLMGFYYAVTTGPVWFTTAFATSDTLASVHTPFTSPMTTVVDLGRQSAPVAVPRV